MQSLELEKIKQKEAAKMEQQEKKEEEKDYKQEVVDFFEKHALTEEHLEAAKRNIEIIAENDPEFLQEAWEATDDLREVSDKLNNRVIKKSQQLGIELVEDDHYPETLGLSTPKGARQDKLDAPNLLIDPIGYERFMREQNKKTPFDGLSEKEMTSFVEVIDDRAAATGYMSEARHYLDKLFLTKAVIEENKKYYGKSDIWSKVVEESVAFPYTMMKAKLNGKLAVLRHSPKFVADKINEFVDEAVSYAKESLEKLFSKKEKENGE